MSDRTISSAAGWMACGAYQKDRSPPGPAAQLGTRIHARLADCVRTRVASGVGDIIAVHAQAWAIAHVRWASFRAEVAYAIGPDLNVRELGVDIDRKYAEHGATPEDICGSADIVGDGIVVDLKTGRECSYEKHAAQMRLLGYCVAKAQGRDRVVLSVLHATKNGATPYEAELDALELAAIGHEIQAARALPDAPRVGPHCDAAYCGARPSCDAYLRMRGAA